MEILYGVWDVISSIFANSGYAYLFTGEGYKNLIMILVSFLFLWLGIKKGFEPLLMIPIAFGMLLANLPNANLAVQYTTLQDFSTFSRAEANMSAARRVLWTFFTSELRQEFIHRLSSLASAL